MIKAQNVVKWFGPTLAVDDVSFEVKRGEVLGFLGPNGAGKSTTMRIITGFMPPSQGKVEIDGHDIEDDAIAAKTLVGYLPENAPAYPEMTVIGFLHFVAAMRGLRGGAKRDAVERVIDSCFLQRVRHQPIETLSKGYRHRTCFAQAIIHDPPVLVMDEPTDGLDPNQKHEVRQLIKSMGKSKAIIVSTHILEEVDAMCNRVIIIDRGKVVFNGGPEELRGRSTLAGAVSVRVCGRKADEIRAFFSPLPQVGEVTILQEKPDSTLVRLTSGSAGVKATLAATLSELLRGKGWAFDELHTEQGHLEEVFRAITLSDTVDAKRNGQGGVGEGAKTAA